jgi:hypothetical protein
LDKTIKMEFVGAFLATGVKITSFLGRNWDFNSDDVDSVTEPDF